MGALLRQSFRARSQMFLVYLELRAPPRSRRQEVLLIKEQQGSAENFLMQTWKTDVPALLSPSR